ncbi:MAG: hypothetical protein ACRBCL_09115 [Maritimibacter sp.]
MTIEYWGLLSVTAMVIFYALEDHARVMTLGFAAACAAASSYAYMIGSYPFMLAEGIWALIALRKWHARATP